jgi:hypothetical protein
MAWASVWEMGIRYRYGRYDRAVRSRGTSHEVARLLADDKGGVDGIGGIGESRWRLARLGWA